MQRALHRFDYEYLDKDKMDIVYVEDYTYATTPRVARIQAIEISRKKCKKRPMPDITVTRTQQIYPKEYTTQEGKSLINKMKDKAKDNDKLIKSDKYN